MEPNVHICNETIVPHNPDFLFKREKVVFFKNKLLVTHHNIADTRWLQPERLQTLGKE